jgi:hypothetical protein
MKRGLLGTVVALLVSTPLGSAWAQFDPDFNHLECYSIKAAQRFIKRFVTVETQFGVQTNVEVLKPIRLCLPAHKTGPGQDPLTPTPVPHFLCYQVKAKTLFPTDVTLTDQFGTLRERTKKPQLLCTPVVKVVTSPTTTSSTTTTSTSSTTSTTITCGEFPPNTLPEGSYQLTCDECSVQGCRLSCLCLDELDIEHFTTLNLAACSSGADIANLSGTLACP